MPLCVENVVRHFRLRKTRIVPFRNRVEAVDEVGTHHPCTLTVIAAILPMAFVGGLMAIHEAIRSALLRRWSFLSVAFIVTPGFYALFQHETAVHGKGHQEPMIGASGSIVEYDASY